MLLEKIDLYHFPICPFCRTIRLILNENNLQYNKRTENVALKRDEFILINESEKLPFLIIKYYKDEISAIKKSYNLMSIFGMQPIMQFVQKYKKQENNIATEIETNKIIWFTVNILYNRSIKYILKERIYKHYIDKNHSANLNLLTQARKIFNKDLMYFEQILEYKDSIAADTKNEADLTLGAFLSSMDYLNEIDWNKYANLKNWYGAIKSRPSFRDILQDFIEIHRPATHYSLLDF